METICARTLIPLLKGREENSHKGNFGHLLLVCGCDSMPGAAVLACEAALNSGCGLVTLHSTRSAAMAAVTVCPSAMLSLDGHEVVTDMPANPEKFNAIAVGPGLGRSRQTAEVLANLLDRAGTLNIPVVIDADALNLTGASFPRGSVITPHAGELKRLLGKENYDDDDVAGLSRESGSIVVAKGFHTRIFTPEGQVFVNTSGNAGMAKGGSGDVLTGLIGGLVSRGYSSLDAARLGVWIHGYAGDILTGERTSEAYCSKDLADRLYEGFNFLYKGKK